MKSKIFKQPSEKFTIAVDFANRIPTGAVISSQSITATDPNDIDVTATVIEGPTISGTELQTKVKAGTADIDYKVTMKATLDNNDVLEEDVLMQVREL